MEKKLKQLFDYQKFARNSRLDAMLAEAEGRCAALEDDDLGFVSAAGETPSADGFLCGDTGVDTVLYDVLPQCLEDLS